MSITLPKNLTSIDDNAFNGCGGLRDISIPSGVTSIGKGAFKGCSLKEFTLPKQGSTTNDSTATEVARFDANGNLLAAPAKGLNIVRYSDGTVKKIMVE